MLQHMVADHPIERSIGVRDLRHINALHAFTARNEVAFDIPFRLTRLDTRGEMFFRRQMQDRRARQFVPDAQLIEVEHQVALAVMAATEGTPEVIEIAAGPFDIVQVGREAFPAAAESRETEKAVTADAALPRTAEAIHKTPHPPQRTDLLLFGPVFHTRPFQLPICASPE